MCDDCEVHQDKILQQWEDYMDDLRARKLGRYKVDLSCDDEVCFHLFDDCPDLDEYGFRKDPDGVTFWSDGDAYAEEVLNRIS